MVNIFLLITQSPLLKKRGKIWKKFKTRGALQAIATDHHPFCCEFQRNSWKSKFAPSIFHKSNDEKWNRWKIWTHGYGWRSDDGPFWSLKMRSGPLCPNLSAFWWISSPNNGKFLLPVLWSITCLSPFTSKSIYKQKKRKPENLGEAMEIWGPCRHRRAQSYLRMHWIMRINATGSCTCCFCNSLSRRAWNCYIIKQSFFREKNKTGGEVRFVNLIMCPMLFLLKFVAMAYYLCIVLKSLSPFSWSLFLPDDNFVNGSQYECFVVSKWDPPVGLGEKESSVTANKRRIEL